MKQHSHISSVLIAEDKFSLNRKASSSPKDLTELGDLAIALLNDKKLQVSKVRPFFWSLVETYVDRFRQYPFDAENALFSYLELNEYPEETTLALIKQLESRYEKTHGRPLRKSTQILCRSDTLDEEIKALRDSIRYAALVSENIEK